VVVVERLMAGGQVDLVDLSMWDVFKEAVDPEFAGRSLLDVFTGIDRGTTRLGAAGKLYSGDAVQRALDLGVDVVVIGRAAITDHDFPELIRADAHATMRALPVSRDVLRDEGLSVPFIDYMAGWKGFVAE
jgi:2,4-dienoyl-CoA reductase-like NADH-dependent reductase (Old Yellow Enzyme family)